MSNKVTPNLSVTDGFDFVKKIWGNFPMPSVMSPTTDIDELDKRISDLKTVEQWLNLNVSMLRVSIQGLEVQRGTIAALQSFGSSFASAQTSKAASDSAPEESAEPGSKESAQALVSNASAWWTMMQEQFSKVASAALSGAATNASVEPESKAEQPAKETQNTVQKPTNKTKSPGVPRTPRARK